MRQALLLGGGVGWWQALTLHGCVSQAKALVTEALKRLAGFNRRTLDALAARLYFYYSWAHECTGTLADIRRWRPRPPRLAAPGTPWTQTRNPPVSRGQRARPVQRGAHLLPCMPACWRQARAQGMAARAARAVLHAGP